MKVGHEVKLWLPATLKQKLVLTSWSNPMTNWHWFLYISCYGYDKTLQSLELSRDADGPRRLHLPRIDIYELAAV